MRIAEDVCCEAAFMFKNGQNQSVIALIDAACLVSFYNESTRELVRFELAKHEKLVNCRFLNLDR